jgi:hypothetical protein
MTASRYWRLVLALALAWAVGLVVAYLLLGAFPDGATPVWVGLLFYALYGLSLLVALLAVLGVAAGLLRIVGLLLGHFVRNG